MRADNKQKMKFQKSTHTRKNTYAVIKYENETMRHYSFIIQFKWSGIDQDELENNRTKGKYSLWD